MKLYKYEDESSEVIELSQVTFKCNKADLENLAKFFSCCAENINNDNWEHEHFSDFVGDMALIPDVIVSK